MRVHLARGAATDLNRERQWDWWKPGASDNQRRVGACHHLSRQELQEFAEREGLELSDNCTFRAVRHA